MYGNCNCIFQNKFSVVFADVILYELPVDGVHFYLLPARRLSAIRGKEGCCFFGVLMYITIGKILSKSDIKNCRISDENSDENREYKIVSFKTKLI